MHQFNEEKTVLGLSWFIRCILFHFNSPRITEVFEILSWNSIIQIYYLAQWTELCHAFLRNL